MKEAAHSQGGSNGTPSTLVDWAEWTKRLSSTDPFDPRVGEWTCIAIAIALAEAAVRKKRDPRVLHPENVTVPESWYANRTLTWEQWKNTVRTDGPRFVRNESVRDQRFSKGDGPDQVAAIATILLGLLRRSFRWPAMWNPVEDRRLPAGILRGLLREGPCSSLTAATLEGALLPRSRETLLIETLRGTGFYSDENTAKPDTANDAPVFHTLPCLISALTNARRVLEGYQLSVQDYRPRQMVPISLTQLTGRDWGTQEADDVE